MQSINSLFSNLWTYIVTHKWSKDILRGNILFISLVIIYDLCHFQLAIITWGIFFKFWIILNICYLFKLFLDLF
ncbi:hypothetical protein [Gardnerella vaginalis]|jgi:hypothetical protein|uniref:hypothetical protein n=1 Tax=Limosilactobacillus portuensis TaxID=2742601 RepID=UPI000C809AF0|nr:hypothetical protein CJ225_02640 [Gardnerella vaginalis]